MILTVACCQRWWSELSNQCLTPCCLSKVKDPSRVLLHLRDCSDCAQTSAELWFMLPSADLCSTVCWSLKCHSCSEKSYFSAPNGKWSVLCFGSHGILLPCKGSFSVSFFAVQSGVILFIYLKYYLTDTNMPCYCELVYAAVLFCFVNDICWFL